MFSAKFHISINFCWKIYSLHQLEIKIVSHKSLAFSSHSGSVSVMFLCRSSMKFNEFSISVNNRDHFLMCKQCDEKVGVEEVHVEDINLKHQRQNVIMHKYSSSMRNGKMGACDCCENKYLAIKCIEWSWVGYKKFCRATRVLSTEAEDRGG